MLLNYSSSPRTSLFSIWSVKIWSEIPLKDFWITVIALILCWSSLKDSSISWWMLPSHHVLGHSVSIIRNSLLILSLNLSPSCGHRLEPVLPFEAVPVIQHVFRKSSFHSYNRGFKQAWPISVSMDTCLFYSELQLYTNSEALT